MAAVRHHTVSCFFLERFARDTDRGLRVCQLEKTTGRPRQVGPRDGTVQRHSYSLDIDGRRDPAVEKALGKIENVAAPLIPAARGWRIPGT